MLRLNDEELDIVMRAARPLEVNRRDGFLQEVAAELERCNGNVGPGIVFKICRDVQRRHHDAPDLGHSAGLGKYR